VSQLLLTAALAGFVAIAYRGARVRRFERDVAQRLPPGESGVVTGAEAIELEGGPRAVLLLHGFGDTPQSLAALAAFLHGRGWTVHVPLLPGHGRSLRAFATSGADEWIGAAGAALSALQRGHPATAIVGQSMGAALAVGLASGRGDVPALVLLAPYMTMLPRVARIARHHRWVSLAVPYVRSRHEGSIRDPAERARSLGFGVTPVRLLPELQRVARRAWEAAPALRAPVLVLQSRQDNRISEEDAAAAFGRLGSAVREMHWTEGNGHVLSVDYGRDEVFAGIASWLDRHVARPGTPPAAAGMRSGGAPDVGGA
jgi:carboxylesterase